MQRAEFLTVSGAAVAALALPRSPFAKLEALHGGRLGVFAIDAASGRRIAHRAEERFPMCSTFKVLAVSAVLQRADAGAERLDRHVRYTKSDLLEYAPVTREHLANGYMTVQALCEAAIEYSDNTAANLLLTTLGGPAAVTEFARSIGDEFTRLDRREPSLNTAIPGDVRDTTTPAAIARDLQTLLTGRVLSPASRHRLQWWLLACRTGADCLRAGLPSSWRVGDKTGSGGNGTRNDLAAVWPAQGGPIFISAYYTGSRASSAQRNAVLAGVGRIVHATLR
jgi:beta-lactamase class A